MLSKRVLPLLALSFSLVSYSQCPADATDLANGGSFSGPCVVDYGSTLTITGDVIWTGGTMEIQEMWENGGLIISSTGSLTIQSGTFTLNADAGFDDSQLTVQAGGELIVETGADLNVETNITIAGTATIDGSMDITTAGTITVSGSLNVAGSISTTATGPSDGTGDLVADGGTVVIENGGFADIADDAKAINSGVIRVATGGQMDVADKLLNSAFGDPAFNAPSPGSFVVQGTVNVGGEAFIFDTTPDSGISGLGTLTVTGTYTNNESDFSSETCGGGASCSGGTEPLPVELISFGATESNNSIVLEWNTATELNNEGFYLERSFDGEHFQSVGFISGHGTTNSVQHYTFSDKVIGGDRFYRLKQVDFDGAFEYHSTIFLEVSQPLNLAIYPNPVVDEVKIIGREGIYSFKLIDASGRYLLNEKGVSLRETQNRINGVINTLDRNRLYILSIESGGQFKTIKIRKN